MTHSNTKQWKLKAITEALGDLELTVNDKLTVGRGQDNDVVLGSKQVSRQHAELTLENDQLMVQDLGSSNGTLVNDQKLVPHQPTVLNESDTVTFAAFTFQVQQHEVAQTTTPVIEPTASEAVKDQSFAEKNAAVEQAKDNAEAVKRADIEGLNEAELEQRLEEELEGPIAMGDPNQDHHPNSKQEHFEELAAEADPEVHRAKQAAAAQLSATTNLHETVEPSKPVAANIKASNETQPKKETQAVVTPKAPVTTETLEKAERVSATNNSFNTVKEQPQHNVAHVSNSTPTPNKTTSGKNNIFLWIALILLGLAVALWLYNSGTLA